MWMIASLALADCGADLSTDLDTLADAETVDAAAVDEALACHAAPLTPTLAARAHGLYARAYAEDTERAAQHLYAAWEAQPFLAPTLPADHPATVRLVRLQEGELPAATPSPDPFLQVDGVPSTWVRAEQPYLAQAPGRPASRADGTKPFEAPPDPKRKGRGLLYAGVGTGVVAGGLYAGAWASRSRYDTLLLASDNNDARRSSYNLTNGLSVASVVGAVASAGLLTVHVTR